MKKACVHRVVLSRHFASRLGKKQKTFRFKPGVNILAGPNGSGKSTILEAIQDYVHHQKDTSRRKRLAVRVDVDPGPYLRFDFEHDNPRIQSAFSESSAGMLVQLKSHFVSHGEMTNRLIGYLATDPKPGSCVCLDEPEQALDMEGIRTLVRTLKRSKANQVIVATHAPALILEPAFNIIELRKGYRDAVGAHLQDLLDTAWP